MFFLQHALRYHLCMFFSFALQNAIFEPWLNGRRRVATLIKPGRKKYLILNDMIQQKNDQSLVKKMETNMIAMKFFLSIPFLFWLCTLFCLEFFLMSQNKMQNKKLLVSSYLLNPYLSVGEMIQFYITFGPKSGRFLALKRWVVFVALTMEEQVGSHGIHFLG